VLCCYRKKKLCTITSKLQYIFYLLISWSEMFIVSKKLNLLSHTLQTIGFLRCDLTVLV